MPVHGKAHSATGKSKSAKGRATASKKKKTPGLAHGGSVRGRPTGGFATQSGSPTLTAGGATVPSLSTGFTGASSIGVPRSASPGRSGGVRQASATGRARSAGGARASAGARRARSGSTTNILGLKHGGKVKKPATKKKKR